MVLKVTFYKTNVVVRGSIIKDGMSKSKDDPCRVCRLRVNANSVLYVQCVKWIYGRCAGVKWVTPKFSKNFVFRKYEGNIEEAVKQGEALSNDACLGDRIYENGRFSLTVRTAFSWVAVRECGELLCGKLFHLKLKYFFT